MEAEQNEVKCSSLLQAAGATNAAINPTAPDISSWFIVEHYQRSHMDFTSILPVIVRGTALYSQLIQPVHWIHKPLNIPAQLEDHNSNLLLGNLPPRKINQTLQQAASALYPQRMKLHEKHAGIRISDGHFLLLRRAREAAGPKVKGHSNVITKTLQREKSKNRTAGKSRNRV